MNILLTGASGFIGRNVAAATAVAGHRVKPATRGNGFDFCRMQSPADWLPHLEGVDCVINSAGIIGERGRQTFSAVHTQAPAALFRACAHAGVRRVLQISALGADKTAFSAYHLSKRAADDTLRGLDLDWFVLRPSLIYGQGGKSAALFMWLAGLPMIPVIDHGQQAIQPVHISDVVATVMQCLASSDARQTLDIVGPATITFAEWLQTLRAAQGLPRAPLLPIPLGLALPLARVGRHFNPILQPENLRMLEKGYWADFQPLARFLGRMPAAAEAQLFFADVVSAKEAS